MSDQIEDYIYCSCGHRSQLHREDGNCAFDYCRCKPLKRPYKDVVRRIYLKPKAVAPPIEEHVGSDNDFHPARVFEAKGIRRAIGDCIKTYIRQWRNH